MNDTTPPPGAGSTDRFFSWLRSLGITRSDDRWFAGVAGGIAAKAKIDPLIVRGIFVVLAVLGGPGILLYLAAWLMLPDTRGRMHLEDLFRGRASAGTIATAVVLGVILVVPAIIWALRAVFLGPWGWNAWGVVPDWVQLTLGIVWWAVVVPGLVIWLIVWLNRRSDRGSPGAGEQASEFADRAGARASEWSNDLGQRAEAWGRNVEEKSKEWERRSREYHAAHRLGAVHVVLTLALALLAAGIGASWALLRGADSELVLTAGLVSGVAVLAVSTILAGIRGRDSGWVGFLSFCGVLALLFAPFSTVLPAQTEVVPFGDSSVRPADSGDDRAIVSIGGNATVDLSDLGPAAQPRTIDVWLLGGNTTVRMPERTPTRVRVQLLAGTIVDERGSAEERRQGGVLMSRTIEQRTAGHDDAELVVVRVHLLGGNAYIEPGDRSQPAENQDSEIEQLKDRIEELEQAR